MSALLIIAVLFALLLALTNYLNVKKKSEGTELMSSIAKHIQIGANAFLKQEYKVLIVAGIVIAIILGIFVSPYGAIAFVLGATMSALAGWVGMKIATISNVRVANEARITKDIGKTLKVAFQGGSVMGLAVGGFALLGLTIIYFLFGKLLGQADPNQLTFHSNFLGISDIPFTMTVSSYALGCSVIAMINRVGGGIYTKAADMGADLVGKTEAGIPEDDPRNPATIADNVGDNVGDVAGLGSDLLESYVGAIIASIVLACYTFYSSGGINGLMTGETVNKLMSYPLIFSAIGLISCSLGVLFFNVKKMGNNPKKELNKATIISAGLTLIGSLIVTWFFFTDSSQNAISGFAAGTLSPWICAVSGIISGILIGQLAEYFTSYDFKPTRIIAQASEEGPALTITQGLGVGMSSVIAPVALLALCIIASNMIAGLYGVAMAALGMLSFVSITVSVDTYGPIADNAGGISEMSKLDPAVRKITDELDAVGNTTAAIGKGFAIGSAAFAALSLFASYLYALAGEASSGGIDLVLNMLNTLTLAGALVGAALPFLFSGILIDAVANAARKMVVEVRRQFKNDPGIIEGTSTPDYEKCISISSKGALSEMRLPAFIAVAAPLVGGFIFGPLFVGGLLIGTTLSAIMLAIYTANAGGAWDNAKKYIEMGNYGGKGSDTHNASIVGDTVGDPLKDTVGPSLDILIKIMSVVSLIAVSVFSKYNIFDLLF